MRLQNCESLGRVGPFFSLSSDTARIHDGKARKCQVNISREESSGQSAFQKNVAKIF